MRRNPKGVAMTISKIVRGMIAAGCVGVMSLSAQTTTTTDTTGTMSTETTTTAKKTVTKSSSTSRTRVRENASTLASILADAQNKANFSADAWRITANEANSLANKVYASSGGRAAARELRTHVRQMRD